MRLSDVAVFFDQETVKDGYSSVVLFKAQFSSFDGRLPDGSLNKRRQMSVGPNVKLPARDVILYEGQRWILGDGHSDTFQDVPIRKSFSLKKATGLYQLFTPGNAATGDASLSAYGQALYFKDFFEAKTASDNDPLYNLYFGVHENIKPYPFAYDPVKNQWFHRRNLFYPIEGYACAACDELDFGRTTFIFAGEGSEYDPEEDRYTGSAIAVDGLLLDYTQLYQRLDESDPSGKAGDKAAIVSKADITPKPGDTFIAGGMNYRVKAVKSYEDAWLLHAALA